MAYGLLARLPNDPSYVVCDRGYAGHAFREHVRRMGTKPTIPPRRTDPPVRCDDFTYRNRNVVERLLEQPKEWRAVATRRRPHPLMNVLSIAATLDRIKG